ncbi:MAG TPA: hypothetical protein VGP76_22750 [Planctomycetaceae bacterium]|jgi:hypothetical protein|nr:hypothetical protein [Planctomycetaceae bacterium]
MNAQCALRSWTRYLRREDYASAVLLANNELLDGHLDNASLMADALDEWESGSNRMPRMAEHAFCFRSVYRSMLFEDFLRRAIGALIHEQLIPPTATEVPIAGQEAIVALRLRLAGMDGEAMDAWLERQWRLAQQVTQQWAAPTHSRGARPLLERS